MAQFNLVKTNWPATFNRLKIDAVKYAPQILTVTAITGFTLSTAIAVKNTPKAVSKLAEAEDEKGSKLTTLEIIEYAGKYYILPAALWAIGVGTSIASCKISDNRIAAFSSMLAATQAIHQEYRDTVKDKVGAKKEKDVEDATAQKIMQKQLPDGIPSEALEIEETGHGNQIFYLPIIDKWFRCDISWIRKVESEINRQIEEGDINPHDPFDHGNLIGVPFDRFLTGLGLKGCDIGMVLGWNGKNKLHLEYTDLATGIQADKAVVVEIRMDRCFPQTDYNKIYQEEPKLIPFRAFR